MRPLVRAFAGAACPRPCAGATAALSVAWSHPRSIPRAGMATVASLRRKWAHCWARLAPRSVWYVKPNRLASEEPPLRHHRLPVGETMGPHLLTSRPAGDSSPAPGASSTRQRRQQLGRRPRHLPAPRPTCGSASPPLASVCPGCGSRCRVLPDRGTHSLPGIRRPFQSCMPGPERLRNRHGVVAAGPAPAAVVSGSVSPPRRAQVPPLRLVGTRIRGFRGVTPDPCLRRAAHPAALPPQDLDACSNCGPSRGQGQDPSTRVLAGDTAWRTAVRMAPCSIARNFSRRGGGQPGRRLLGSSSDTMAALVAPERCLCG
jgi:hypothetical protein